jgi:hypothetical protein
MSRHITLDVERALELKEAFARTGWTESDIGKLCEGNMLGKVLQVLNGTATIEVIEVAKHIIHCSALPYNPWADRNWYVERHEPSGSLLWYKGAATLYRPRYADNYPEYTGNILLRELSERRVSVLNANVLDYLLENPHLIPEEWKSDSSGNVMWIAFWGTMYRDPKGRRWVRFLYWKDDREWAWDFFDTASCIHRQLPSAVRAR